MGIEISSLPPFMSSSVIELEMLMVSYPDDLEWNL